MNDYGYTKKNLRSCVHKKEIFAIIVQRDMKLNIQII